MNNLSSENDEMSASVETELNWISARMRTDIAPPNVGSVGARILKTARTLGWNYFRAKAYWYADERIDPKPAELRRVEKVTGKQYAPHRELRSVDQLISNAEALLEGQDPDFHRGFVAALRAMVGALDRTGTGTRRDG